MHLVYPDYYPEFQCKAAECKHNCCIGWEIDIDPDSFSRYMRLPGPVGGKLRQKISIEADEPHFRLGKQDRCPFLNRNGLCRLIRYGGEGMLCQICRDHPRFRTFLPDRTELGLGLCCEGAARLILTQKQPTEFLGAPHSAADAWERALLSLRRRAFCILRQETLPLSARAGQILRLCGAALPALQPEQWTARFLTLARLDASWTDLLGGLQEIGTGLNMEGFSVYMQARKEHYARLLQYFLYRHMLGAYIDKRLRERVAFSVLSTAMLYWLGAACFTRTGMLPLEEQLEYARMYSAEVEYAQENVDALLHMLKQQ